jgi:hypothetical protein
LSGEHLAPEREELTKKMRKERYLKLSNIFLLLYEAEVVFNECICKEWCG